MSLFEIQKAIDDKLAADSAVQALLGNPARLYDAVPPSMPLMPYVTYGEMIKADFDTKTSNGHDVELTIHSWSSYRGKKETEDILQAIYNCLHRQPLTATGYTIMQMRVIAQQSFMDSDGLTRHGVARVRIIVE